MNEEELNFILQEGEGQNLEFKSNTENIGKDITAFANTNKGIVLVGVNDIGKIAGIKNIKRAEEEIANIAHSCCNLIKNGTIMARLKRFKVMSNKMLKKIFK